MQRASFSIVFLLLTVMCFPQGFSTKVYSAEDGLLDNWPTGIAQDGNGNLWIRHSRGFTKFDGIMFTAYYDKKTDSHQYWDRNNYVTNENGIVYTAGLDLKHFPGSVQNVKLDSFLVYQDRRYEKKSRTKNLIDRNGYRIFTAIRGGQNNLNKVYFQFKSKLDSLLGPLSSCKHISKIKYDGEVITTQDAEEIYKDNLGSVYIRFCDTVQLTNTFYLFDKGRLHKILTSGNFGSDVRIVTTLNGLRWIIGNTNKTLYAECLNDRGKTVKVIVKPGFFHQDNMRDVSKAVADSKNNIWFSWGQTGLVKLGMQGVEIFRDEGRDVPKVSQLYYDVNGRESFQYVEEYSNFYLGFAIDHYDNIICGDRLFDGKQFSALSVETAFTSLFRTTNGTAITSINDCFVDRENNVWLAITHGLIKLSPTPFKKIDTRLSSAEADYEMDQTDSHGRKYYKKNRSPDQNDTTESNQIAKRHL